MHNLLSGGSENIRFNLLAIVDDRYETASDELEMLKRERIQLERRLDVEYPEGWSEKVRYSYSPIQYAMANMLFVGGLCAA